jgi:hypothetical protein
MEIDSGPEPEPAQPPERDYSVSATGLVSRTFKLWFRNILAYVVIVGIVSFIWAIAQSLVSILILGVDFTDYFGSDPTSFLLGIISILTDPFVTPTDIALFVPVSIVIFILSLLIYAIIAGAAVKYALDDYGTKSADISESFSFATGRAVTLILAQLIIGLITGAIIAVPALLLVLSLFTGYVDLALIGLAAIMVAIVVILYVSIRLAPTIAVVIAEDLSAMDSVKRAWTITSGNFWHIFGGQILLGIAIFVVSLVIGIFAISFALAGGYLVTLIITAIASLLLSPLNYVFQAVLYKDLKSRATESDQEWW